MAWFEWAQVVAFDGEAKPPLKIDDLLGVDPSKLRLALQPYLTLIELHWPLDEFSMALKRRQGRGEASNAADPNAPPPKPLRRPRLPKPEHVFVAVHRLNNSIYYKRLEPAAYALLTALRTANPSPPPARPLSPTPTNPPPPRSASGSRPGPRWAGSARRSGLKQTM